MYIVTGKKLLLGATFEDGMSVEFNPATGNMMVGYFGKSPLFDELLTAANRTG